MPLEVGQSYRVKETPSHDDVLPSNNKAADALAASSGADTFIADSATCSAFLGMNDTHFESAQASRY